MAYLGINPPDEYRPKRVIVFYVVQSWVVLSLATTTSGVLVSLGGFARPYILEHFIELGGWRYSDKYFTAFAQLYKREATKRRVTRGSIRTIQQRSVMNPTDKEFGKKFLNEFLYPDAHLADEGDNSPVYGNQSMIFYLYAACLVSFLQHDDPGNPQPLAIILKTAFARSAIQVAVLVLLVLPSLTFHLALSANRLKFGDGTDLAGVLYYADNYLYASVVMSFIVLFQMITFSYYLSHKRDEHPTALALYSPNSLGDFLTCFFFNKDASTPSCFSSSSRWAQLTQVKGLPSRWEIVKYMADLHLPNIVDKAILLFVFINMVAFFQVFFAICVAMIIDPDVAFGFASLCSLGYVFVKRLNAGLHKAEKLVESVQKFEHKLEDLMYAVEHIIDQVHELALAAGRERAESAESAQSSWSPEEIDAYMNMKRELIFKEFQREICRGVGQLETKIGEKGLTPNMVLKGALAGAGLLLLILIAMMLAVDAITDPQAVIATIAALMYAAIQGTLGSSSEDARAVEVMTALRHEMEIHVFKILHTGVVQLKDKLCDVFELFITGHDEVTAR